jgi:hypothetical protein
MLMLMMTMVIMMIIVVMSMIMAMIIRFISIFISMLMFVFIFHMHEHIHLHMQNDGHIRSDGFSREPSWLQDALVAAGRARPRKTWRHGQSLGMTILIISTLIIVTKVALLLAGSPSPRLN